MSNQKNDIRFLGFNKYVRPEIKVLPSRKYVLNGKNNEFYTYLNARYYGSVTHSSVCNSYIDLMYGRGLDSEGQSDKDWKRFEEILSKKDIRKVCADYQIYREYSVQIIRQKGNKNEIATISHIAKNLVVPSVENEDGEIVSYWFSRDWSKLWKYPPIEIPAFGMGEDGETEIYVGKPYSVGKEYFPDPDYLAALPYTEFEEEVANYYVSHVKNGLSFGNIINVPSSYNWSDDQKNKYERQVKENTTGSSNAGKVIVAFLGGNEPVTISTIENNTAHKQWDFLTKEARQQILTAHKTTSPSIVGVISSTGFSNTADEMDTAEEQLMKRVISPKQNFITDGIEDILSSVGLNIELKFLPLTEIKEEVIEEVKEEIKMTFNPYQKRGTDGRWILEDEPIFDKYNEYDKFKKEIAKLDNDYDEAETMEDEDDIKKERAEKLLHGLQEYFGGKYTDINGKSVRISDHAHRYTVDYSFVVEGITSSNAVDDFRIDGRNDSYDDAINYIKSILKGSINLCSHDSDLDLFLGCGEDIDLEKYDLIDEIEVDYAEEITLQLSSTGVARPNSKSSQDSDDIIIRYKYVGNPAPERSFCRKMMNAGKVYRKEDILQLDHKVVNEGFGMSPNPNAPYSIWLFKGGGLMSEEFPQGTCKHKWNRVIYLKKGKKIDANSPLAQIISTSEARRRGYKVETNDSRVSIAPHDMK